jgi:predicted Zn-dependent protease
VLSAELERTLAEMATKPDPAYYVMLAAQDMVATDVQATHGAASAVDISRGRSLDVDVRVGSMKLDNTHKIRDAGWFSDEPRFSYSLPLSVSPAHPTRLTVWSAIDDAWRASVRRLVKVRTNDAVKVEREDTSDDFSPAPPVKQVEDLGAFAVDGAQWQDAVRRASAVFLNYPEIHDSNTNFRAEDVVRTLVSSEGTRLRSHRHHARVATWAGTVAPDGMELSVYDYVDAASLSKLPNTAALVDMAHDVARRLVALRAAPMVDPYVGPAILRGRAAAVFFHEILGHRAEGHRQKDEDEGQTLTDKVGEEIFPPFISVHDDPTLPAWGATDLNGHYRHDDEGVAAQRVTIVESGVLRGFLLSRAPIEGFPLSNGHGRRQAGNDVVARQGNLLVSASKTVPYDKLKAQLIAEIKAQGKPFGLIFDDISGGFTFTGRTTPNSYTVKPVTVWRVWPDGRPDELVRGVDFIGTPLTTFKNILAASDRTDVFNGVCGAESGWVPVSAVAPDLLVREVEVQRKDKANDRPPLLPPPLPDRASAAR